MPGTFLTETGQVTLLRPKAPPVADSRVFFRFSSARSRVKSLPQLALDGRAREKAEQERGVHGGKAEIAEETVLVWGCVCGWPETGGTETEN